MWILELIGGSDKPQWSVLKHNGPMFPPEYEQHKVPVIINGKEIQRVKIKFIGPLM